VTDSLLSQEDQVAAAPDVAGAAAESTAVPVPEPAQADAAAARPASQIIAIANQKGGVGKTTTVVSLAACLGELGQRILVVDLDPQANATSGLGVARETGSSIYEPLLGRGDAVACITRTASEHVDLIPSELDLAGSEIEVARADQYLHRLRMALATVRTCGEYDLILVDCPPSLGILTMNALAAADSLLVPMQCEYYALEGLSVIHRLMAQLRESGANPALRLEGIVMTMYDARTNLAGDVVREVNRHFGDTVYDTVIPRNVRLSEAPSFGKPVTVYDPHSAGAMAYRRLAEEFLDRRNVAHARLARTLDPGRRIPLFRIKVIAGEGA
jgi:chromosome partitioning protein